jgi:hypothetical protein
MAVQPLLAEMSRINNNGRSKAVEQKTKAQKALGEQIIALTHRERPYMAMLITAPNSAPRWQRLITSTGNDGSGCWSNCPVSGNKKPQENGAD